jgi:hypothetical protein
VSGEETIRAILLLKVDRPRTDIHGLLTLDEGDDPVDAGTTDAGETSQTEHDGALVFLCDADAGEQKGDGEKNERGHGTHQGDGTRWGGTKLRVETAMTVADHMDGKRVMAMPPERQAKR